jgi:hypothetical protein
VLVWSSHLQALVDGLVESGEWEVSKNYADIEGEMSNQSLISYTPIREAWLKACFSDPAFDYLRSWPKELYHLSADYNKVEVPDVSIRNYVERRKSTTGTHISDLDHHYCDTLKKATSPCYHLYKNEPRLRDEISSFHSNARRSPQRVTGSNMRTMQDQMLQRRSS